MKIEVGKKYIQSNGNIIEIKNETTDELYCFMADNNIDYTDLGCEFASRESKNDLICEVDENLYSAYKQDLITEYEFLNKHFELHSGVTLEQYNQSAKD